MGDVLKISKDKRHRSSSSLGGVAIENTRSERILDVRASIPETEDQFTLAEARCDELQQKIDLVKTLKRKRKLKKRSSTRVNESPTVPSAMPLITVHTQPKKKISQQTARMRRLEVPMNPTRGYLDPATVEQHQMLGQVHGYSRTEQPRVEQYKKIASINERKFGVPRRHRSESRADGDSFPRRQPSRDFAQGVGFGKTGIIAEDSDNDLYDQRDVECTAPVIKRIQERRKATTVLRRKNAQNTAKEKQWSQETLSDHTKLQQQSKVTTQGIRRKPDKQSPASPQMRHREERPVVELYHNAHSPLGQEPRHNATRRPLTGSRIDERESSIFEDQETGPLEDVESTKVKHKEVNRHPRREKYRSHRYELPTVASQMKQSGTRFCQGNANHSNIPFVVSKSTAPSHNIGLNIQQVLNGLKIQQPLSGIPLTIAHHMGLRHIPTCLATANRSTPMEPSLDKYEINVIKLGERLLRLPSYRSMSYNRLLQLYQEGEGMVPRFLRAISRPHYFYTSMYNLTSHQEDGDNATSKGRSGSQEAKQSLAEYASLYREYEDVERRLKAAGDQPELRRRVEELRRELVAREQRVRRVVQEYKGVPEADQSALRASASTAEEGHRHSTFKLNFGDPQ